MATLNAALANVQANINTGRSSQDSSARSVAAADAKPSSRKEKAKEKELDNDGGGSGSGGGGGGGGGGGSFELSEEDENAPILVYCRLRPSRGNAASKSLLALDPEEKRVEFNVPKSAEGGNINNTRESFKFNFNGLFDEKANQEDIFEGIGKRVVDNVISGYNGTIFGQ